MTCARSSKRTREGRHQAQTVWHQPAWKPVLTSGPPSSKIFNRSLELCEITLDPSHSAHSLFELLPSGRRYRALSTRRPDTETVSSLRQSISWTLDNKRGTHNTIIHYLFITHTYFSFQIFTCQTSHIIVYIIYCVIILYIFCTLPICIFVHYSLSFMSCPVSVILLHCGASVRITNSSYVSYVFLKFLSHSHTHTHIY